MMTDDELAAQPGQGTIINSAIQGVAVSPASKNAPLVRDLVERLAKEQTLIEAVQAWASDSEGMPGDSSDARLLKALWTYEGDRLDPCPECDGECGEPCAPATVAQAHATLDRFIERWNKAHGVTTPPTTPEA